MLGFVTGGAASGKSAWAERFLVDSGVTPRTYLATLEPQDDEDRARIKRHRDLRSHLGFSTLECYKSIAMVQLPACGAVLWESLGISFMNEFLRELSDTETHLEGPPHGFEEAALMEQSVKHAVSAVLAALQVFRSQSEFLLLVGENVFEDVAPPDAMSRLYLEAMNYLSQSVASKADLVVEVVCGVPIFHKGMEFVAKTVGVNCLDAQDVQAVGEQAVSKAGTHHGHT